MNPAPRKLGKWLRAVESAARGDYRIETVSKSGSGQLLGYVEWYARWRTFQFVPAAGTGFTWDCLRDLSVFVAELNQQRTTAGGVV